MNFINFFLIIIAVFLGCEKKSQPTQPQDQVANPNPPTLQAVESLTFPIMTWFGLPSNYLDLQHFQDMADAGFTINFSHLNAENLNMTALSLGQQAGVKQLIMDSRIQPDKKVDETALKLVDEVIQRYKSHPAFFGYHVRDEPSTSLFSNLAAIKNRILSQDQDHLVYSNLNPDYGSAAGYGASTYQEYVNKFMLAFKPQILSYDHYPFTSSGFRQTYYQNLEEIRTAAIANNVPFWAFTMSCAISPPYPNPQESWIRLQVFSDLAYGARGIQYFTYGLPHSSQENFTIAILDDGGNKTYLYDIAKRVNSEVHALASTLKQIQSLAVYHSTPLPQGTNGLPGDFIVKSTTGLPLVIGYFKDSQNRIFLFLVNRDYNNRGDAGISVSNDIKGFEEISKKDGSPQSALTPGNNIITMQFEPGDGRLFRVVK